MASLLLLPPLPALAELLLWSSCPCLKGAAPTPVSPLPFHSHFLLHFFSRDFSLSPCLVAVAWPSPWGLDREAGVTPLVSQQGEVLL